MSLVGAASARPARRQSSAAVPYDGGAGDNAAHLLCPACCAGHVGAGPAWRREPGVQRAQPVSTLPLPLCLLPPWASLGLLPLPLCLLPPWASLGLLPLLLCLLPPWASLGLLGRTDQAPCGLSSARSGRGQVLLARCCSTVAPSLPHACPLPGPVPQAPSLTAWPTHWPTHSPTLSPMRAAPLPPARLCRYGLSECLATSAAVRSIRGKRPFVLSRCGRVLLCFRLVGGYSC